MKIKNAIIIILVLLLAAFAGCNKAENTPMVIDIEDGGTAVVDDTTPGEADPPVIETDPPEPEGFQKAYLDILQENSSRLTSDDKNAYLKDGKVAVMNVFGNEAPELLYIYLSSDNPVSFDLAIWSYTEPDETVQVFDSNLLVLAGGGGNYCVYLDTEGYPFIYRATYGTWLSFGFWPFFANQNLEIAPEFGAYNFSPKLADIYFYQMYGLEEGEEDEIIRMVWGDEVLDGVFNTTLQLYMDRIDTVIFQSSDLGPDGDYGLYKNDNLWKDIPPFEAKSMTLAEAIAWLEGA